MAGDYLVQVAAFLAAVKTRQVARGALGVLVDKDTVDRKHELEVVYAAIERLDAYGFLRLHHLVSRPVVEILDQDGLKRLAAGELLATVAAVVEVRRDLTIVRADSGRFAAWYLPANRLPAKTAWTDDPRAGWGDTADAAVADLQRKTRAHQT